MKTLNIWVVFLLVTMFFGCNRQVQDNSDILNDVQLRAEIMNEIIKGPKLMSEMITHMGNSDNAMLMLKGNQEIMGSMMGNDKMMKNLMSTDSLRANRMMRNLLSTMGKDSILCKTMRKTMSWNKHFVKMSKQIDKSADMMSGATKERVKMHCPVHGSSHQ